jgi:tRNA threonylcarbamoyladenosine biosynthesis protein TsaB
VNLLALDTATEMLSLAVLAGKRTRERTIVAGQRHAELIVGEIDALLVQAGLTVRDLNGIAYGAGPGSFTGLRIACGVAQGIAAARGIPVLGIGTLAAMAASVDADRVIACLDARMGEVYHAAFEKRAGAQFSEMREVIPPGLHRPDAVPLPPGSGWTGCGAGFAVYRAALETRHRGVLSAIVPDVVPSAAAMLRLAAPRFAAGEGADPALASPLYVRDRVALKTAER